MEKRSRAIDDGVSTFSYILGLPDSVTQEIFFRLPIKDVKRCRSVCKSWRTIICDPEFSVVYSNNSNLTPLLYFRTDGRLDSIYHLYLLEISQNGGGDDYYLRTRIVPNMLPGWFDGHVRFTFVGSCKGYICLIKHKIAMTLFTSSIQL